MMDKLLHCPFCDSPDPLMRERYINGIANKKHYKRECRDCHATFTNWYKRAGKADEAWNRRTQPENKPLTLEELRQNGCIGCKYEYADSDSVYCTGCKQNAIDKYVAATNADRIRSTNDEELADWIDSVLNQDREDWNAPGCYSCINYGTHHSNPENKINTAPTAEQRWTVTDHLG